MFEDQVALITGAGRGLGAAYARLLAAKGASVVVHDAGVSATGAGSDPSVAGSVAEEIVADGHNAFPATGNLLDDGVCESLIEEVIERHGRLDVLIHNAGVVLWEESGNPSDDIWDQTMGVNADAAFRLIRAALPPMRRQGYGRIVLTTSGRATRVENGASGLVSYAAAKMAVYGLMVGFAVDLGEEDIQINAISPAAATRVMRRDAPELTPESVAPGVAYLASPAMTESGHVLAAAGGRFRLDHWQQGQAIDLGPSPTIEELTRRWAELARSHHPSRRRSITYTAAPARVETPILA